MMKNRHVRENNANVCFRGCEKTIIRNKEDKKQQGSSNSANMQNRDLR